MHIKLVSKTTDIKKISILGDEIFGGYYEMLLGKEHSSYMVDRFFSKKGIQQSIDNGIEYYLINNESEDIGFIALQCRPAFLYISKFYIKEEYRGKGYFNVVFNIIKGICFKHNYKSIKLNVNKYNELAIAVYEHIGFVKESSETIDIGKGFVMDDYVYEYKI